VIAPHNKNTSKRRIFHDSSAHYQESPSLNDILHRRTVIPSQLLIVLLCFITGRVVVASDVEKASLHVRYHRE
ncbi:hypothetical protein Angca_000095, partial [Angiostrongylus cantonensis]